MNRYTFENEINTQSVPKVPDNIHDRTFTNNHIYHKDETNDNRMKLIDAVQVNWSGMRLMGYDVAEYGDLVNVFSRILGMFNELSERIDSLEDANRIYTITYWLTNDENYTEAPHYSYTQQTTRHILKTLDEVCEELHMNVDNSERFQGWRKQRNSTILESGLIDLTSENTNLYMYINNDTYTLNFNGNGGICMIGTQTLHYNSSITLPLGTAGGLSKEGYTFNGWNLNSPDGQFYSAGSTYIIKRNTTFYANWVEQSTPTSYTITYDANGGSFHSGVPTSYTVTSTNPHQVLLQNNVEKAEVVTSTERKTYSCERWEGSNGISYHERDIIRFSDLSENITLSASWYETTTPIETIQYTITYDENDGPWPQIPKTYTINAGSTHIVLSAIQREKEGASGYSFKFWKDDNNNEYPASTTSNPTVITPTGDITLHAQWQDYPARFTVIYNLNGGDSWTGGNSNPQIKYIDPNQSYEIYGDNVITRNGYNLVSWNSKADGSGTTYEKGSTATSGAAGSTLNLYAQWEEIQQEPTDTYYYYLGVDLPESESELMQNGTSITEQVQTMQLSYQAYPEDNTEKLTYLIFPKSLAPNGVQLMQDVELLDGIMGGSTDVIWSDYNGPLKTNYYLYVTDAKLIRSGQSTKTFYIKYL